MKWPLIIFFLAAPLLMSCSPRTHMVKGTGDSYAAVFVAQGKTAKSKKRSPSTVYGPEAAKLYKMKYLPKFGEGVGGPGGGGGADIAAQGLAGDIPGSVGLGD